MFSKLFRLPILAAYCIMSYGCGTWSLSVVDRQLELSESCDTTMAPEKPEIHVSRDGKISKDYLKALIAAETQVDPLLDCLLAPVASDEARAYRGHVILSLLAAYGAYNFEIASYEERIGDAVVFLAHIQQAENSLREGSRLFNGDIENLKFRSHQKRLERVLYVLEVALYAERPTLRRAGARVRSLLGAVGTGLGGDAVQGAADAAVAGLAKSIRLRHFGKAYLQDAIEDLRRFEANDAKAPLEQKEPTLEDWQRRDGVINDSCTRIAKIANLQQFECIQSTK